MLFADLAGLHAVHRGARLGRGPRDARHVLRPARADDPRRVRRRGGASSSATRSSPSSTRPATSRTTRCARPVPASRSSEPRPRSRAGHPDWPHFRVGINSGEVLAGVVGDRGHRIHGVFGDTVNLGARLEGKSPVGGVMIGAATYEQLPARHRRRARSGLQVKGKADARRGVHACRSVRLSELVRVARLRLRPDRGRRCGRQPLCFGEVLIGILEADPNPSARSTRPDGRCSRIRNRRYALADCLTSGTSTTGET